MLRYKFPNCNQIDPYLDAIAGMPEFIVAEKDGYTVINYMVEMENSFRDPMEIGIDSNESLKRALRLDCRGIKFDPNGNVISKTYHKFFNVNQKEETQFANIPWHNKHHILEKMDGSMVSPFMVGDHLRWGTKMGITDTSMFAETFTVENPEYIKAAMFFIDQGKTPIFEWCSRKSRIVIDYPVDQLVLTAVRDNFTGEYTDYEILKEVAAELGIKAVVAHDITENLMQTIQGWTDAEGVVVRFDNGHMVKIKAEQYMLQHKSKDAITREKNVIGYIVNNQLDDVMPFLTAEDRARITRFADTFYINVQSKASAITVEFNKLYALYKGDVKEFAVRGSQELDGAVRGIMFKKWREPDTDIFDELYKAVSKNLGSQAKVDEVRWIWGDLRWDYEFE